MPEITDAELRMFTRYQNLGTVDEVTKKINDLEKDNADYRKKITDIEAKVPGADKAVVDKTDVVFITELKPLGNPDEIKQQLEAGSKAEQDLVVARTRVDAIPFVRTAGLHEDVIDTLIAIPELRGATFEVRKGKIKDGKGKEVDGLLPYIKLPGEDKAMSFEDAKEKVPALKGLRTAEPGKTAERKVGFVDQGGEGKKSGSRFDHIREEVQNKYKPKEPSATPARSAYERLGLQT